MKRSPQDGWYQQRFTPRRARSRWSEINVGRAEALIAAGRMRPAGLAEVERAKADRRWDDAYAPPSRMEGPDDLRAAAAFDELTKSQRYSILWRVHDAKRPETRERRIAKYVATLERGEKPA